jgi:hypothetical protein
MESDELVKLVNILKENKISYYKAGEVELKFDYSAYSDSTIPDSEEEENEDELLYLSSGVKGIKRER